MTHEEHIWTELKMQVALTSTQSLFSFRRYAVVPNVSWGLGLRHEADLLCLSKSGVFHEVEIKTSLSDLRADKKKMQGHYDQFIRHLWFAIPPNIDREKALDEIPDYSGLVVVGSYETRHSTKYKTEIIRRPRPKKRKGFFIKPTPAKIEQFLRLGVMRMWSGRHK